MSDKTELNPLAAAIGAALAASVLAIPAVSAESNPFGITTLSSGYMIADSGEKSGDEAAAEGGDEDKNAEGKCGEGKCGEGKCGEKSGDEAAAEGGDEAAAEGGDEE